MAVLRPGIRIAATQRICQLTRAVRKILICDDMPQVLRRYWIVLQTVAYVYRVADIEVTHFLQVLNRFVTIGL
jgi:hypothetical protein